MISFALAIGAVIVAFFGGIGVGFWLKQTDPDARPGEAPRGYTESEWQKIVEGNTQRYEAQRAERNARKRNTDG